MAAGLAGERRRIALLAILCLALVIGGVAALVACAWSAIDAAEVARERLTASRAVARTLDRISWETATASIWDETWKHTHDTVDTKWLEPEVANYLHGSFGHEMTLLIDSRGKPAFGVLDGKRVPPERLAAAFAVLAPASADVSGRELERRLAAGKGVDFKKTLFLNLPIRIGDEAWLICVSPVSPQQAINGYAPSERPAVLISGRRVGGVWLRQTGADLGLRDIVLSSRLSGAPASAPIRDSGGRLVAEIRWRADDPGAGAVKQAEPFIILGALGLAAAAAALMFEVRRLFKRARDSENGLIRARDEAEAANVAKSEFLANMSHEIRTPLNGVVGLAALLSGSRLPAREREMAMIIDQSARSLERLLSDILDLAKVEAGQIVVEATPFHLGELMRSVAGLCRLQADEKGLRLDLAVAPDADGEVMGDPTRIRQVLINLASNAVKFTEAGSVSLATRALGGGRWRFEVSDTGVGFDGATAQRLFRRFQQADGSITRRFGGSGLGLAISRELVELMGGEIGCASTPGSGSVFWFELDLTPAPSTPVASTAASDDPGEVEHGLRVLLADDHPVNRKVVALILDGVAEITEAEDGLQAVELYAASAFDVVLMDMQMPVMDGLEAVRRIRALEAQAGRPRVSILMLTANALPQHVEAGHRAGADGHIAKPVTPEHLMAALRSVAEPKGQAGQARESDAA